MANRSPGVSTPKITRPIKDPGIEVVRARLQKSPARLSVGDKVLWFQNNEAYGFEVEIIGDYELHPVLSTRGVYVRSDGSRFNYRYGYLFCLDGNHFFGSPHQLTRDDQKPSHLCLVKGSS